MKIERRWPKSPHLPMLVKLYQSKMYDNIVLADNILDELTLNLTDASYILQVIRKIGYLSKPTSSGLGHYLYRSTYYLAKIKHRSVKNYIVVKRNKNKRII